MSEIPNLTLTEEHAKITVGNWDNVDQWACANDAMWRDITRLARVHDVTEEQRLHLLVYHYMTECARLREELGEAKRNAKWGPL